ncbi:MAG: ferritin family protein [Sphaerochaeta sp.]|uniref:ferritin family protein n=1 Tax=Sphaerochaeta sp. TaxID=1972642 RepID=UPI002FCA18E9
MDLFEVAIKLEEDGAQFYTELAKKTSSDGFANIFSMLAEDEKKHENIFRALQQRNAPISVSSTAIETAKTIFRAFNPDAFSPEEDQIPAYEEALAIEKKSIDFYKEQLPTVVFDAEKKALNQILAEEQKHYAILEEILKLVTRPHRWVENAEFGVREDY